MHKSTLIYDKVCNENETSPPSRSNGPFAGVPLDRREKVDEDVRLGRDCTEAGLGKGSSISCV